jgi:hypothetical protein
MQAIAAIMTEIIMYLFIFYLGLTTEIRRRATSICENQRGYTRSP